MAHRWLWLAALTTMVGVVTAAQTAPPARRARISEEMLTITTYPFSEPNPVPILTRDPRLYPYHSFEGYAHDGTPRQWKVVHLENDLIELWVLPEVGGKVWGARVKKTGHEFIYRNEVLKFRNIALRGPWTSGGIEFNFGVIGHTPSTATPVDYVLKENPDGSVSCVVGTMDLPSRTEWRVEVRLPADRAAFETTALWHNPTPTGQPYYNWMTAAAFAKDDLELSIPGHAYLQHSGEMERWPVDDQGRFLPTYRNNTFGGNKSFHVVGALQHFFGGYYRDGGFGFGHWARHEDMPGQKLWLWALSRSGGIWEDLLTDTDGQYVEFQAGRLYVQYQPSGQVTPITQAGFEPYATDRWTETWFPVEGLGGLTDASRDGAMFVQDDGGELTIAVHSFAAATDTLRVWSAGRLMEERPVNLTALTPLTVRVPHPRGDPYRVELRALGLDYDSDMGARELRRPFYTGSSAAPPVSETERLLFEARELGRARRYDQARPIVERVLATAPFNRGALQMMADLEFRRARYDQGLTHVEHALALDTYDPHANFTAGNLYRALGLYVDARAAFGWAARSTAYRSAANVQLAELALLRADPREAERYVRTALDYNRLNLSAWDLLAIVGRLTKRPALATEAAARIADLDPLHHLLRAEAFLAARSPAKQAEFFDGLRGEYPDQAVLELVIRYASLGRPDDAIALLDGVPSRIANPLLAAWRAHLAKTPASLPAAPEVAFVFPYRRETLPVLEWAAKQRGGWQWNYLVALNLWGLDRAAEAQTLMTSMGPNPDLAAFYAARAFLVEQTQGNAESDLSRAYELAGEDRNLHIPLIRLYQQRGRWDEALTACARARQQFPADFNLELLHARSLVNLERADEAIAILDKARVLPSENARESHQLYVQAHLVAAFADIHAGRLDRAHAHLRKALEWPEHLGQGKPYDPEERLVRFLMGRVEQRLGRAADARESFEQVIAATVSARGAMSEVDLLAVPALRALGRREQGDALLARAVDRSADPHVRWLASQFAANAPRPGSRPNDLDGELLIRALFLKAP